MTPKQLNQSSRMIANRAGLSLIFTLAAMFVGGCASQDGAKEQLVAGYKQLESPRPDVAVMMASADAYLKDQPAGPGAAEALYLRGRAYEEKSRQDTSSTDQDLNQAQAAYSQALANSPRPAVEGLIHAGLGNVLYFQNRFPQAISQLTAGFEKLERETDKAWALYRIGLSEQRLSQWSQADQTFASVQQQFPATEQARRAAEHAGARAFWVQVATFAGAAQADAAVADLKKMGLTAGKFTDQNRPGVELVRVGPMASYEAANSVKMKVWGKYNGAMIVP